MGAASIETDTDRREVVECHASTGIGCSGAERGVRLNGVPYSSDSATHRPQVVIPKKVVLSLQMGWIPWGMLW